MDNIWDVKIWREVEGYFPDDNNGSRIMFTSRNQRLAFQVDQNSISHQLWLFSKEESWDLMKGKLFSGDSGCSLEFTKIAKRIANRCKGLLLAVALISSLIGRMKRQLDLWNEVAENLKSRIASEGCQNVIELSYKFLPEHLKSCFLYFGAFPRGENICASTLDCLWSAEGFIKVDDTQCTKDLAKEYLNNLVSENLVVVSERNSMGGIKECNVHDLLYDFSFEKGRAENFLNWMEKSLFMDQSSTSPKKYVCHRLSICDTDSLIRPKPIHIRNELPTSKVYSCLWLGHPAARQERTQFNVLSRNCFRVLRVLNMEGIYVKSNQFREILLFNIHLRYLAVTLADQCGLIPSSISNLWNLETFIVRYYNLAYPLPNSMWKMRSLRHVELLCPELDMQNFEDVDSVGASSIETLGSLVLVYDSNTVK
ncbi:OLC1v1016020C1 [Oldenlandia corymbosa var. corymbosa]|uniref:OLC1v1016020C1 n=1 Tax=Oldenlandia corymbosa var. corymbosa TaxID=529605 RepID=A0AAV1E547_OLDCO|nr:OLC1v1016020C1 [Oldenlandia corymbosa var. corymbosa]